MNAAVRLVQRLRSIADLFPVGQRPTFLPGASIESISILQGCLPAPLPSDFSDFLHTCDTVKAMDVWNGYWIGGVAELTRSVTRGDFPASVAGDNGPVAVVPVATDGGGNAFLLSLCGTPVWKWNHETGSIRVIADDFTMFLQRVLHDWEHCLAGDDIWKYLSG